MTFELLLVKVRLNESLKQLFREKTEIKISKNCHMGQGILE